MPELPEVETIKRILEPQLRAAVILSVHVHQENIIAHPTAEGFAQSIQGRTLVSMGRRGKFLLFYLDNGGRLVLHLRMTGQILAAPKEFPAEKHTHVVMELSNGLELRYIDPRRFGRFWYIAPAETDTFTGLHRLGVEAGSGELSAAYLKTKLKNRKKPIKDMLHDQSVVAGIGNIYSDEILFDAGLYPKKSCHTLSDAEWERLAISIPKIIAWGIQCDAMTPEEYLAGKGKEYRNTPHLQVYGREHTPCSRCSSEIQRLVLNGRSSHYCPVCQQ